ncbi:MAG: LysR family transcriptional regulator [Acetobacter sp.]|nr:LysR family transcriptional regulator [Acetobacter sp.]
MLPDLEAWAVFTKIAETGSFAAAARATGLSRPTISKLIARLEHRLGSSLFHRTSRQLSLTETGKQALEHATSMLHEGEQAEACVREQAVRPHGLVRITAPVSFGIAHLAPLLPEFLLRWPEIDLNIDFSDTITDLTGGGYDLAIRIASLENSSLRTRRLCQVDIVLVSAPDFPNPDAFFTHPEQLTLLPGFVYTAGPGGGHIRLHHIEQGNHLLTPSGHIQASNAEAFRPALLAGVGYAAMPLFMIHEDLKHGRLVRLLPEWDIPPISISLVTPPGNLRPARVRTLMDYLAKKLPDPRWTL